MIGDLRVGDWEIRGVQGFKIEGEKGYGEEEEEES